MLSKTTWIAPTALTIVFALLFGGTGMSLFAALAGIALVVTFAAIWHDFRPRSKYDLSLLQDIHDREELANLDPSVGVLEYDDYLCPYCRTLYSTEYRNCPSCGRRRTS